MKQTLLAVILYFTCFGPGGIPRNPFLLCSAAVADCTPRFSVCVFCVYEEKENIVWLLLLLTVSDLLTTLTRRWTTSTLITIFKGCPTGIPRKRVRWVWPRPREREEAQWWRLGSGYSLLACLRLHPLFLPRHRSVPPGGIRPTTKNPTGVSPGAEISERKN